MYTVINIVGKRTGSNSFYEPVPIDIDIENLMLNYKECLFDVTHVSITETLGLKLSDIVDLLLVTDRSVSINEWLSSIGSTALPTRETPYTITTDLVKQSCILSTDMRIQFVNITGQWNEDMTDDMLVDVSLVKSDLDYQELFDHCLFSVNGLLHLADVNEEGIYINDAATSIKLENKIQLSALSFHGIGSIQTIPITLDLIDRGVYSNYRDGFTLKMPYDISDKTVMLSIAGHLHYNNDCYSVTGDNTIFVDWSKVPIAERHYDGRYKIDWSDFISVAERAGMIDDMILTDLAKNDDDAILAILQMSQTFIILVDNQDLFYEHRYLEKTGLPGRYLSNIAPIGPIQTTDGYLNPYKVTKIAKWYWISMGLNWVRNRIVEKTNYRSTGTYRDGNVSQYPKYLSKGKELMIGKESIV